MVALYPKFFRGYQSKHWWVYTWGVDGTLITRFNHLDWDIYQFWISKLNAETLFGLVSLWPFWIPKPNTKTKKSLYNNLLVYV